MAENTPMKGWKGLIQEAVTKIIHDEIKRQLTEKFPVYMDRRTGESFGGWSYDTRQSVAKVSTEFLEKDPEIRELIRSRLKQHLIEGFEKKPE